MLREGLLRIGLAGFVAALLIWGWITSDMLGVSVAAGLALGYGVLAAVGHPTRIVQSGFSSIVVDSTLVSILAAGTGGSGSPFFVLYLLASLGISRVQNNWKAAAGTLALIGGYFIASWIAAGGEGAVIGPTAIAKAGMILLFCGVVAALSAKLRGARSRGEVLSSALKAERAYNAGLTATISKLGPILSIMDLEGLLDWAANTARDTVGAGYAHVATIDGSHRTAVNGDLSAYPSWWHPTIQRLILYCSRTTEAQRTDEVVRDMEGFLAVPLVLNDGVGLGSIVVGGGNFGGREQKALELLATQVASALKAVNDAPGGRDAITGLPNRDSLYRMLRQRPMRETPLTILAVRIDWLEHAKEDLGSATRTTVLRTLGHYLSQAYQWAFCLEEGHFLVMLRGTNRTRAREVASNLRHLAEKLASDHAAPLTSAVGLSFADAAVHRDLRAPVEAAIISAENAEGAVGTKDMQLSTTASEIAFALVAAAEIHSLPLGEHLRTVSRVARQIGTGMGLTEEQLYAIEIGALLHDVGKIGIPESILQKPGPLTVEEERSVRQHPVEGARLLEPIKILLKALPAVKYHHERFDGTGYPEGLLGEEIPLEARIVLVADAFDSIVRGRPYRYRLSPEVALQEIENNSGTQFDPAVVSALVAIMDEGSSLVDFG